MSIPFAFTVALFFAVMMVSVPVVMVVVRAMMLVPVMMMSIPVETVCVLMKSVGSVEDSLFAKVSSSAAVSGVSVMRIVFAVVMIVGFASMSSGPTVASSAQSCLRCGASQPRACSTPYGKRTLAGRDRSGFRARIDNPLLSGNEVECCSHIDRGDSPV
jgi:hypothetical protein